MACWRSSLGSSASSCWKRILPPAAGSSTTRKGVFQWSQRTAGPSESKPVAREIQQTAAAERREPPLSLCHCWPNEAHLGVDVDLLLGTARLPSAHCGPALFLGARVNRLVNNSRHLVSLGDQLPWKQMIMVGCASTVQSDSTRSSSLRGRFLAYPKAWKGDNDCRSSLVVPEGSNLRTQLCRGLQAGCKEPLW